MTPRQVYAAPGLLPLTIVQTSDATTLVLVGGMLWCLLTAPLLCTMERLGYALEGHEEPEPMDTTHHTSQHAAELTPGTTYVPYDHREPLVRIAGRTAGGGVRVLVGDEGKAWLFPVASLMRALDVSGYRLEVGS